MASSQTSVDETNPSHYRKGEIETIDYIKAALTPEQFDGYCIGNVINYVSRYKQKNPASPETDLKKARWYLNAIIEEYKNEK